MKQKIQNLLPGDHPWQNHIHWFETLASTNTHAKVLAAAGALHGTVLLANHQTGGRGRMGRSFHSPADSGIYLSIILRPACPAAALMHLTCAAAVAAADGIQAATGLRPGIKWINDLVVGQKKLGGILTEMSVNSAGLVDYAIIGIGINCTQQCEDFPENIRHIATSLQLCTGNAIDRPLLIAKLLIALEKMCHSLQDSAEILSQYRKDCITIGQEISIVCADECCHGTALDVDENGALLVQFTDGHCQRINSGEVSIRGMYGYV